MTAALIYGAIGYLVAATLLPALTHLTRGDR